MIQPVAAATGRRWAESEKSISRTHGAETKFQRRNPGGAPPTGKGATTTRSGKQNRRLLLHFSFKYAKIFLNSRKKKTLSGVQTDNGNQQGE